MRGFRASPSFDKYSRAKILIVFIAIVYSSPPCSHNRTVGLLVQRAARPS
jgi:hypothetical protein